MTAILSVNDGVVAAWRRLASTAARQQPASRLLEMLIVLAILAMVATAIPFIGRGGGTELRGLGHELAAELQRICAIPRSAAAPVTEFTAAEPQTGGYQLGDRGGGLPPGVTVTYIVVSEPPLVGDAPTIWPSIPMAARPAARFALIRGSVQIVTLSIAGWMAGSRSMADKAPNPAMTALLEVIVALAILSLGLAASSTVSLGTRYGIGRRSAALGDGIAAQSLLAELGKTRPVVDGSSDGTRSRPGSRWQLDLAPLETSAGPFRLCRATSVVLTVSWPMTATRDGSARVRDARPDGVAMNRCRTQPASPWSSCWSAWPARVPVSC
jgi:type II secretory pathway pseudopilin PulG